MQRKIILIIISCFLLNTLFTGLVFAQGIKKRMKDRIPIINKLKAKGIVGENNKGFLEFVGGKKDKADVISAENADRSAVYAAIAKQQKTTPDLVAKRRALQIAGGAGSGEWLQDAGGQWKKK